MFEDSTFETMGRIHTRSRGWMMATFAFNSSHSAGARDHPDHSPGDAAADHERDSDGSACRRCRSLRPVVRTEQTPTARAEMPNGRDSGAATDSEPAL